VSNLGFSNIKGIFEKSILVKGVTSSILIQLQGNIGGSARKGVDETTAGWNKVTNGNTHSHCQKISKVGNCQENSIFFRSHYSDFIWENTYNISVAICKLRS
jgi:hypothetical protein